MATSEISFFAGFLPLKLILIMSFIILMQSGFLYRGHCVGIGTGDLYSYNEIILIGNILMVSVDCTRFYKGPSSFETNMTSR